MSVYLHNLITLDSLSTKVHNVQFSLRGQDTPVKKTIILVTHFMYTLQVRWSIYFGDKRGSKSFKGIGEKICSPLFVQWIELLFFFLFWICDMVCIHLPYNRSEKWTSKKVIMCIWLHTQYHVEIIFQGSRCKKRYSFYILICEILAMKFE